MPRSVRGRLFVVILAPTLLLLLAAGWAGYGLTRRILEDELGRSLSALAASAAARLSEDRVLSLEPDDDRLETRSFRAVKRDLEELRAVAGLRRVVVFDRQGRVRIDVGGALPIGAEVPELGRDRLELERVWRGERTASQVLFRGSDGRDYKTGYAPLRSGASVYGAVAVEGSAEFFGPLVRLFRVYAGLVALAVIGLASLALVTARAFLGPLERLVQSALRIGRGDLTTPVGSEPVRELGVLASELEQMRQKLEARDRQLQLMLAGVAHEVRNPLGGIELFAGLLGDELPKEGPAREHLGRVKQELAYLKRIVDDFLTFARQEQVSLAPLEAGEWVHGACALLEGDSRQAGVALEVSVEPATLSGDLRLLQSALLNLVKNAVQASTAGGRVEVRGAREGTDYVVQVRDEGPGIAPELLERVFEPFFTTRAQGTGLGLPLARKLVQAHRGALTVESRPGQTVFRLRVPADELRKGGAGWP